MRIGCYTKKRMNTGGNQCFQITVETIFDITGKKNQKLTEYSVN